MSTAASGADAAPVRDRTPALSNWGAFGDDDELGTLNYLTPEAVRRGLTAARDGHTFPLNLPVDLPSHRIGGRPAHQKSAHLHNAMARNAVVNDDHIVLATQGSTQWDSFVHVGLIEEGVDGVYYNGVGLDAIDETGYASKNGIDKFAQRGIVGRGILLDVARMYHDGRPDPLPSDHAITEKEVIDCLDREQVEVLPGDIVCFRTGWTEAYVSADADTREQMTAARSAIGTPQAPGITPDLAELAHRQRWAAVAADNPGVEVIPFRPHLTQSAHVRMMRNLGIPFGELFLFADLATAAAADQRWDFLFVSQPLWIPGGMGSPANAIAIR